MGTLPRVLNEIVEETKDNSVQEFSGTEIVQIVMKSQVELREP